MFKYKALLENINIAIARALNENGVESIEKQMYEQERLEGETWKQMANRVGFTKWYESQGLTTKNIGDTYAKRRQRWLAHICNDKNIIKNEIDDLEGCIECSYLNDDNYLIAPNEKKDEYIKRLEKQVDELNARINELSKNMARTSLNLKNVNIENTFDEYQLHFRNPFYSDDAELIDKYKARVIRMFSNFKDMLMSFKAAAYPYGTIEIWRYRNKQKAGNFERYKALIVTCQDTDQIRIQDDILEVVQNKFNIKCTKDEIYTISLPDTNPHTGNWLLRENMSAFRQFMQMANPLIKIQKYDDRYEGQYLFFYLIELD